MTYLYQKSFPIWLAVISFATGTFLFLGYFIFDGYEKDNAIISGVLFVLLAIIVNSITLLYLVYQYFMHPIKRDVITFEAFFILANIPVAILYFYTILTNFNTNQSF